ncbi:hypothetical protein PPYR_05555 [Photinus pyralis]|uniref:Microtubule-associated protein Jupiter n=1 Tax=Photinus pyralis TaxID=7054 RepID=A0A1Y1MTM7_PHOPY|nr:hypothetical protein PPYR_05555 [Photinus pyralis]
MTSTNVNVGIEGKSSSRVLRPPGGSHSDIFGSSGNSNPRICVRQQDKSSISACFDYDSQNKEVKDNRNDVKADCDDKNEENSSELPAGMPTIPNRVRVPPGGFSTSLW